MSPAQLPVSPLRRDLAWSAVALLAVWWLYLWTATDGRGHFQPAAAPSLLDQQVEAFHRGHVALETPPSADLIGLKNPYDPAQNRGSRLLDAAYFKGRYYTYFGPAPSVLFLWPWRALTNRPSPPDLAALVFASIALLCQTGTLLACKRRWLSTVHPGWLVAAIAAVGAGNLIQPLLRGHGAFELPILSELAFANAGVFFLTLALSAEAPRTWAWQLASLSFGLACASRPNFVMAAIPLGLIFVLSAWRRSPRQNSRRLLGRVMLISWPALLCLAGMGAYNFARFGSPFDLGNTYTLVEVDWRHTAAFALRYLPTNLYLYLVSIPRLSPYFPFFVESAALPFAPGSGYLDYIERVVGLLPAFPFILAGIAWPRKATQSGLRVVMLAIAAGTLFCLIPLLLFIGSSLRYEAEFACPLVLLAGIGLLVLAERFSGAARAWVGAIVGGLALWTGLANFFLSCAANDSFRNGAPEDFKIVAKAFDPIAYSLEQAAGWEPKIPRLTLRFPTNANGKSEPLAVFGKFPEQDFIYVYYSSPDSIQLGFEHMGHGGPLSDYISVDYSKPHTLDLIVGSLLPPASHPFYVAKGLGNGEPLPHLLRLVMDGKVVTDAVVEFHRPRDRLIFGSSPDEGAFGWIFTGSQIFVAWRTLETRSVSDLDNPAAFGERRLQVRWPQLESVRDEPLVSIGARNRGELCFVRFEGHHRIRIGLRDSAGRDKLGEPFLVSTESSMITVKLAALFPDYTWPAATAASPPPPVDLVFVDGREAFRADPSDLAVGPAAVAIGRNAIQAGRMTATFTGAIQVLQTQVPPPPPLKP